VELRESGLALAVASGRIEPALPKLHSAGLEAELVLNRNDVGVPKGSSKWVERICTEFGIQPNELLWLGDTDLDMRSAVNGRLIYFNARWSSPDYRYGIQIPTPRAFSLVVRECFLKPRDWYWQLDVLDNNGNEVVVRALIDGRGAGIRAFKDGLIEFLHSDRNPKVGLFSVREFTLLHVLGSLYSEGLYREADTWTIYPSRRGGPNAALAPVVTSIARLSHRQQFFPTLIDRHTPSLDTSLARVNRTEVRFDTQTDTVRLAPDHQRQISGKTVVVVDDFTTDGFSFEWARNELYRAGAKKVICVCIGKYPKPHHVMTPVEGYTWDPFVAARHPPAGFKAELLSGAYDRDVLSSVRASYERVAVWSPG
jgi:hypothetical protein